MRDVLHVWFAINRMDFANSLIDFFCLVIPACITGFMIAELNISSRLRLFSSRALIACSIDFLFAPPSDLAWLIVVPELE